MTAGPSGEPEPGFRPAVAPGEAERIAAAVVPLLPPVLAPFFPPRFTHSHLLFDEFVYRLTLQVVGEVGLAAVLGDGVGPEEAVARSGLDPTSATVPVRWMLEHLAARGVLAREEGGGAPRFAAKHPLPILDPAEVQAEQDRHDPACRPAYALAGTAARDYPAFLRGVRSGEAILLAPARLSLWTAYFSNDNPLYEVNNRVGAAALETWLPAGTHTVLELGGGFGSGTAAVLERLAAHGRLGDLRAYRFTEMVPTFLRRAQRLQERFPDASFLTFDALDMNRPFAEQGVGPGSVSVVYAVNTLHVAHDLAFTLGEIRQALGAGGRLIISEGIRPTPRQTLYPEFVFNLLATFRAPRLHPDHRPTGGFLTPEQWTRALLVSGFEDVRMMPDIPRIREAMPTFYVAALGATRPASP